VSNLTIDAPVISDHSAVTLKLPLCKPPPAVTTQSFRKIKDINIDNFQSDILRSSLHTSPAENVNDLANQYYTVLQELLNTHAPKITKKMKVRPITPWYTSAIKSAKTARRKAERQWRSSKLAIHLDIFRAAQCKVTKLCTVAKSSYMCEKIHESKGNQKQLFKIANDLLYRKKARPLPSHTDPEVLANDFADFFSNKISKIYESFLGTNGCPHSTDELTSSLFDTLHPTCESELRKLIMQSNTKSCALDPIPTSLLKQCLDCLLPVLVRLINLSFSTNAFPDALKLAIIHPLLKKSHLDPENKKHYRPVSNLPFLGKLIEKTAIKRFSEHISDNQLEVQLQSAYKEYHCVETALLVVFDDLLCALDSRKHILVTLLDYSAAFDTIDHSVLLRRLQNSYGVYGGAIEWIKSYLTNRHQAVSISNIVSKRHDLTYGMPQGSLFGPFGYPKYSRPIARIAEEHGIYYHQYADDTQLYVMCDQDDAQQCKDQLEKCIEEIRTWSTINKLKLNDSKTEFLIISSKHSRSSIDITSISIGDSAVSNVKSAKNIGAVMDSNLTMAEHISSICKSAYFHLRNIAQIRRSLTQDAAAILIHSLVTSRLDNLNSLLFGLPDNMIVKLQYIQNHAAKVVVKKKKSDHVTPILQSLHWLPVAIRIEYKLMLITYKCLHGKAPEYLASRLHKYVPSRTLRSADQYLLVERRANLKSYGERSFSVACPKLWNKLPLELRKCDGLETFKSKLKTFLFKKAFT
jgi:hypothetical protein